jgi:signal transduction histidine kinase
VEFFLLVAGMAVSLVMAIPWVLAYSRGEQAAARWPCKIVTSQSAQRTEGGAYRGADVSVERVVSVEQGPPAPIVRSGRAAFFTASAMFVGGVLVGAWVPVSLWLRGDSTVYARLSVAYAMGLGLAVSWMFAAYEQFRSAWDRFEPTLAAARNVAKRAFNAAVMAAGVSMLVAIALRVAYGAAAATMVPVWFAWVLLVQAWASRRSIEHNAALYTAAEANELERSERAPTGVRVSLDERDEQRADVGEDTRDRAAMEAKKVCA